VEPERRQYDKKVPGNKKGESLLYQGRFEAKSNSASFGGGKPAWIWDLKDNDLRFVGHLSYGIVHYLPTGEVVWSPDSRYVALPCNELSEAGATEQIYVTNVETGESKRLTPFVGANTWPVWSPDSKKIMYVQVPPKYWWSLDYVESHTKKMAIIRG
jgi:tricorn protease-like protein